MCKCQSQSVKKYFVLSIKVKVSKNIFTLNSCLQNLFNSNNTRLCYEKECLEYAKVKTLPLLQSQLYSTTKMLYIYSFRHLSHIIQHPLQTKHNRTLFQCILISFAKLAKLQGRLLFLQTTYLVSPTLYPLSHCQPTTALSTHYHFNSPLLLFQSFTTFSAYCHFVSPLFQSHYYFVNPTKTNFSIPLPLCYPTSTLSVSPLPLCQCHYHFVNATITLSIQLPLCQPTTSFYTHYQP